MFDENEKLQKYNNVNEIIEHYIKIRYSLYTNENNIK